MTNHHALNVGLTLALATSVLAGTACDRSDTTTVEPTLETAPAPTEAEVRAALVARGEMLVSIGGCNDCHTPWVPTPTGPAPDMARMLSSHAENGPEP